VRRVTTTSGERDPSSGFTVLAALGLQALLERRPLAGRRGWIVAGSVVAATTATSARVGDRTIVRSPVAVKVDGPVTAGDSQMSVLR
jgi:hypothetical protein